MQLQIHHGHSKSFHYGKKNAMPKMSHNQRHAMARKLRHGESVMTWQGYFDMVRTSRNSKTCLLNYQECHSAIRFLPQKECMATARIFTLWQEQHVNPLCKVSSLGNRNDTARTWHVTFCHGMLCQMHTFTFMHLADAFVQSDLQYIQAINVLSVCSLGIEPTTFCAANTMLYHWATGTLLLCTWPQNKEHATRKAFSYKQATTRMSYIVASALLR